MNNKFNIAKKGGYEPAEVDSYIDTLESIVKSYKEKDSAIKNAILNAQIAADNIIKNANAQSKEIKETALKQVANIMASVSEQRNFLNNFKNDYQELMNKYLVNVNEVEFANISKKIDVLENYLNSFTSKGDTAGLSHAELPEEETE